MWVNHPANASIIEGCQGQGRRFLPQGSCSVPMCDINGMWPTWESSFAVSVVYQYLWWHCLKLSKFSNPIKYSFDNPYFIVHIEFSFISRISYQQYYQNNNIQTSTLSAALWSWRWIPKFLLTSSRQRGELHGCLDWRSSFNSSFGLLLCVLNLYVVILLIIVVISYPLVNGYDEIYPFVHTWIIKCRILLISLIPEGSHHHDLTEVYQIRHPPVRFACQPGTVGWENADKLLLKHNESLVYWIW